MLKPLWRALVDGLIDNDEKVASSKKQKPRPIWDQNSKMDTLFLTKTAKKPLPLGLHMPTAHVKEYPTGLTRHLARVELSS